MKRIMICFLALLIMLMSACVPPTTATPDPTVTPLPAEKMTFVGSETKEIYVINEKGQYLVELGAGANYMPPAKPSEYDEVVLGPGMYTNYIIREILSYMLPDLSEDQYVSDEMFSWFMAGASRSEASVGELLYLYPEQYEKVCNSKIFKDTVIRYWDNKQTDSYKDRGYAYFRVYYGPFGDVSHSE